MYKVLNSLYLCRHTLENNKQPVSTCHTSLRKHCHSLAGNWTKWFLLMIQHRLRLSSSVKELLRRGWSATDDCHGLPRVAGLMAGNPQSQIPPGNPNTADGHGPLIQAETRDRERNDNKNKHGHTAGTASMTRWVFFSFFFLNKKFNLQGIGPANLPPNKYMKYI